MSELTQLGNRGTVYTFDGPNPSLLETFQSPEGDYLVTHKCFEWSSLCPVTGQPDFGTVSIRFKPCGKCVETKSLKLYLFSFRNVGMFMEAAINRIADDLQSLLDASWLIVEGTFNSRGGIETSVYARRSKETTTDDRSTHDR